MMGDEDYGYEMYRQRKVDTEPDGDPYEERKLRWAEDEQDRQLRDLEMRHV